MACVPMQESNSWPSACKSDAQGHHLPGIYDSVTSVLMDKSEQSRWVYSKSLQFDTEFVLDKHFLIK